MARYLYSELASLVQARLNCIKTGNQKWEQRHRERITELVRDHMPHGSGFDNGTRIDMDASHADKLVFHTSFHHVNESGMYDGWTEHTATVLPSLSGDFRLRISGRNRNDIRELIDEEFRYALCVDVSPDNRPIFLCRTPECSSVGREVYGNPVFEYDAAMHGMSITPSRYVCPDCGNKVTK